MTTSAPAAPDGNALPRGIRNNNPCNLRPNNTAWQGLVGTDTGGGQGAYLKFASMVFGVRAGAKVLISYQKNHGIRTLLGIFTRWAPASDHNDPASYAGFVAEELGVKPGSDIDIAQPRVLAALLRAIIRMENGAPPAPIGQWVAEATIEAGIQLALA